MSVDATALQGFRWRPVGPFRGGRVIAVAGHPTEMATFYMGSTGGGVWKTEDGGTYWENISDGYFKRASVGAIAVSEADPNVIYVGMGESTIRSNVSHGDGVYKSVDGGRSWEHVGLTETRNISKVRIHPTNPDLVYVAALGHAHGPNPERGVYRSTDGGKTWELVLFRTEEAGAVDLSMDLTNPRVLYAAFWEGVHRAHELVSGGPGSGLFRSDDGGDTWQEITRNRGLPEGMLGRMGIVASPAKPGRVWAIIEAKDGGVYRSDNYGESWVRTGEHREVRQRPWYYMHIFADPVDPETVWVLNLNCWKSTDAGNTFQMVPGTHGDYHDLWIDPKNTRRMIQGNDGGATVSFNGGETWSTIYNQPTTEFYHVITDNQTPYRIYGAQQDNTTMSIASRSNRGAITAQDSYEVGGGESGYIAIRPDDPNIIFAGNFAGVITRYDHRTSQRQNIQVWPEESAGWGAADLKYRFQWTFPIVLSPHDPDVLYITSQFVHRSTDEGHSWEVISPDLTRNDKSLQGPSGGPITIDSNGMDYYCTIFAFAESPLKKGILWTGSDDGLVHVSTDNGETWTNVTPPDMPEWSLISIIDASPHEEGAAYIAVDRHRHDDFAPYLYKTSDFGKTWTKITNGIPEDDFMRVVREDPNRRGLLYAGSETGIYISFDDGENWQPFRQNLPVVPVHDLVIKDSDIVLGTHGRGFWVLDDATPLYEYNEDVLSAATHLFKPRPAIRYLTARGFGGPTVPGRNYQPTNTIQATIKHVEMPDGTVKRTYLDAGENPPDGAVISYYLKDKPEGEVTLTFMDADGNEIKRYSSKPPAVDPAESGARREPLVPVKPGLNRFVWDMRYPDAYNFKGAIYRFGGVTGPIAPPGTYRVRLEAGDVSLEQEFDILKDPRSSATNEDLQEQFALMIDIRDTLSETNRGTVRLRNLRNQLDLWEKRAEGLENVDELLEATASLKAELAAVENELLQTSWKSSRDALTAPSKLNAKLATLMNVVASADARPTKQSREVYEELRTSVDIQLNHLTDLHKEDVPAINSLIRKLDLPALLTED